MLLTVFNFKLIHINLQNVCLWNRNYSRISLNYSGSVTWQNIWDNIQKLAMWPNCLFGEVMRPGINETRVVCHIVDGQCCPGVPPDHTQCSEVPPSCVCLCVSELVSTSVVCHRWRRRLMWHWWHDSSVVSRSWSRRRHDSAATWRRMSTTPEQGETLRGRCMTPLRWGGMCV